MNMPSQELPVMGDVEEAAMLAHLPQARACIARMLHEAEGGGVPAEAMTAALLAEVLQRLNARGGPLAVASVLGNAAAALASSTSPPRNVQ